MCNKNPSVIEVYVLKLDIYQFAFRCYVFIFYEIFKTQTCLIDLLLYYLMLFNQELTINV